jgi:signal transduction histidine kinase/FixJ family two-component response regulator
MLRFAEQPWSDTVRLSDAVRKNGIALADGRRGARDQLVRENIQVIDQLRAANQELALQIARRRDAEQQQTQSLKMEAIGQLTGGLAHELNNLLAIVIGNLDMLREQRAHDPQSRELASDALGAALRGAELIRRMLAFARRQSLAPEQCDINELIDVTAGLLRRTLGEDIVIDLQMAADLWPALIDRAQLESAITNLAANARQAMPQGGRLTIRTCNAHLDEDYAAAHTELASGDYASIEVIDTGTGISPDILDRIFDPFITTKEPHQGTGLGLSMVFGFLTQSGGHITAESELGVGSTFRLYIPLARSAVPSSDKVIRSVRERGCNKTILVVDDNAGLRRVLSRQLTGAGYRVLDACNARAALDKLETDATIDLLLTDIVMPGGMDGRALASAAVQLRPRLKTLLMSGHAAVANDGGLVSANTRILQKPYLRDDMLRLVYESLAGVGLRIDGLVDQGQHRTNGLGDALARAERNVREGERRVARQIALVAKMDGLLQQEAQRSRALLATLENSLGLAHSALMERRHKHQPGGPKSRPSQPLPDVGGPPYR